LLDNIELNREFTVVTDNNIFISQSPGFNLERVIDNKKSWVDSTLNRQSSISNNMVVTLLDKQIIILMILG
jgi:hypothetical protein